MYSDLFTRWHHPTFKELRLDVVHCTCMCNISMVNPWAKTIPSTFQMLRSKCFPSASPPLTKHSVLNAKSLAKASLFGLIWKETKSQRDAYLAKLCGQISTLKKMATSAHWSFGKFSSSTEAITHAEETKQSKSLPFSLNVSTICTMVMMITISKWKHGVRLFTLLF